MAARLSGCTGSEKESKEQGINLNQFKPALYLEQLSSHKFYLTFSKGTPDEVVSRYRSALEQFKKSRDYQRLLDKYAQPGR